MQVTRPSFFLRIGLTLVAGTFLLSACVPSAFAIDPTATKTPVISPTRQALETTSTVVLAPDSTVALPQATARIEPSLEPTCLLGGCIRVETATETPIVVGTPPGSRSLAPKLPLAYTRIQAPGPLSRVVSPINVEASVIPGTNGIVRVELIGEDGRAIARQVLQYNMPPGQRFLIHPQVDFEIPSAGEAARLLVSVEDESHRVTGLASVDLILLSMGAADLNPAGSLEEPFIIQSPRPEQSVAGGSLTVTGVVRSLTDQPLLFELYTDGDEMVGSRQVALQLGMDGEYVSISTEIPYQVSKAAWARLVVHQASTRIPGDVAVVSQRVYLTP